MHTLKRSRRRGGSVEQRKRAANHPPRGSRSLTNTTRTNATRAPEHEYYNRISCLLYTSDAADDTPCVDL
eukprot:7417394-Pyramimonas_sp.AAC.1